MAMIMRMVMASRWSPVRRPSIFPDTTMGVAPATTWESPFLPIR